MASRSTGRSRRSRSRVQLVQPGSAPGGSRLEGQAISAPVSGGSLRIPDRQQDLWRRSPGRLDTSGTQGALVRSYEVPPRVKLGSGTKHRHGGGEIDPSVTQAFQWFCYLRRPVR